MNYKVTIFQILSPQVPKVKEINLCVTVDLVITGTKVPSH